MKLMPKVSSYIEQTLPLKDYINKYEKMEIQFFQKAEGEIFFDFETIVREYVKLFNVKEITIHPPLSRFELEYVLFRDENSFFGNIEKAIKLSREFGIKINLLYHARWDLECMKYAFTQYIKKALDLIKDDNVTILLENSTFTSDRKCCSVLEFCDYIHSPKLKFCLDICHVYCHANIYKLSIEDCLAKIFDKEKIKNNLQQIHFSYTANNDGYIDKNTHGIVHPSKELLEKDVKLLKDLGADENIVWVTEVGEKNYLERPDQKRELDWISEVL